MRIVCLEQVIVQDPRKSAASQVPGFEVRVQTGLEPAKKTDSIMESVDRGQTRQAEALFEGFQEGEIGVAPAMKVWPPTPGDRLIKAQVENGSRPANEHGGRNAPSLDLP